MTDSDSAVRLALLTVGDPRQLSGGYLYQQRMAAAAHSHDAQLDFISIRPGPFARQVAEARRRLMALPRCHALLVDSIVAAPTAWWLGSVARDLTVIAVVHQQPGGTDHRGARLAIRRRLDLVAYRRATGLVAVSEWLGSCLREEGIRRGRIAIVPPGHDVPDEKPATAADLRLGRRAALLCVSNWTRNKGLHLLLEAMAASGPDMATLHLVGNPAVDRRYARRIHSRISRSDLRHRVVVHGSRQPSEVAHFMQSADVFVHASRHEAYGAVVAEAMSAGLPVIAFRTDNLPYLVRDGIDGMLAPYGDVRWLAAALRLLIENSARRQEMGASARDRTRSWPTWAQSAERFFGAVRQVVAARQAEIRT